MQKTMMLISCMTQYLHFLFMKFLSSYQLNIVLKHISWLVSDLVPQTTAMNLFGTHQFHYRYQAAMKDNDFVYHEKIPAADSLPEVKGKLSNFYKCGNKIVRKEA